MGIDGKVGVDNSLQVLMVGILFKFANLKYFNL